MAELEAYEIGLTILGPLRELDEVAYLRFASVYQGFDSLEDFEAAINLLRAEHEASARSEAGDDGGTEQTETAADLSQTSRDS